MKKHLSPRLAAALVAALAVLAYLPSLWTAIVWDDHVLLEHGARCKDQLARCLVTPFFPSSPFLDVLPSYYRPMVTLSFALLPAGAFAQHLVNVLCHALVAALLVLLATRLGATPRRAALAAVVWALHPRLVEDVTWISGRTDLLAAALVLGAALAWPDENDPRARGREALAAVLLFLGLLSKEVAVAGFFLVVAMAGLRRARARAWVLLAPAAVYAGLRAGVLGRTALPSSVSSLGPAVRLGTIGEATARYVEMTVLFAKPWTARGAIGVLAPVHVAVGFALLAALAYATYRAIRGESRGLAAAAALFAGSLLPVLHVVPISLDGAVTADRALYLPLAGVALAIALAPLPGRLQRPAVGVVTLLTVAEALFGRPAQHAFDDDVLFGIVRAERADPANVGPESALAAAVRDAGAPELACPLFESARRTLEQTGRARAPAYARATENLGACLAQTGSYDASVVLYRALAQERPQSGRVALGLGYAELHRLDFEAAAASFSRAAELDPSLRELALQMRGESERAAKSRHVLDGQDAVRRARYAATVGRAPDAERAWLTVALDPAAPASFRAEAVRYLAAFGSPEAASAALRAVPDATLAPYVEQRVAAARLASTRRDRIAALAAR